jgi:TRAP transporter TAXI family solute receptor
MKRTFLAAAFAVAFAMPAMASDAVRLCTGADTGVYYAAGKAIQSMAGRGLPVEVIETEGTFDNLTRVLDTNECDAMIGQPDGPVHLAATSPAKARQLRQVAQLHREYLHVICSRESGVTDIAKLPGKGSLAIGEAGSGAWLIWQNILRHEKSFEDIPVTNEGGIIALSAVSSNVTACMLQPAGLRNGTANEANNTFADTVVLASATSRRLDDATNIDGKKLYEFSKIPSGTYKNLQSGWFSSSVSTLSWHAGVYVNTESFTDAKKLAAFIQAVSRASIAIKAEYGK